MAPPFSLRGICSKHRSSSLYGTSLCMFLFSLFFSLLAFMQQNQVQNIHRLERNPCSWVPSVPMRNGECTSSSLRRTYLLCPFVTTTFTTTAITIPIIIIITISYFSSFINFSLSHVFPSPHAPPILVFLTKVELNSYVVLVPTKFPFICVILSYLFLSKFT